MLFVILIYNFMVFGLDLIAMMVVAKQRSWLGCLSTLAGILAAVFCLAIFLAGPSFAGLNLLSYGLFVHIPLVLFCTGAFFFRDRRILSTVSFLVGLLVVGIAVDVLLVEPRWLQVTHQEISSLKLTESYRIAIVADLQTDQLTGYERGVFEKLAAESPDMVLFAGDYLQAGQDDWFELADKYQNFFREIGLSAPLGVFAVGGNTDHPDWQDIFSEVPATTSSETHVSSATPFQLTQLSVSDSFDTTLTVPSADAFHIVLGHAPDFALGQITADLLVAGHTHGGQVQIPFFGPIVTMSAVPRSWASGVTKLPGGATLAVSRGIGMERGDAPRVRFFCRPELMILDLVPALAGSQPVD